MVCSLWGRAQHLMPYSQQFSVDYMLQWPIMSLFMVVWLWSSDPIRSCQLLIRRFNHSDINSHNNYNELTIFYYSIMDKTFISAIKLFTVTMTPSAPPFPGSLSISPSLSHTHTVITGLSVIVGPAEHSTDKVNVCICMSSRPGVPALRWDLERSLQTCHWEAFSFQVPSDRAAHLWSDHWDRCLCQVWTEEPSLSHNTSTKPHPLPLNQNTIAGKRG